VQLLERASRVKMTTVICFHIHDKFNFQTRTVHSTEACDLLRYYAACSCNFLQTFRDNLSVPSSRVQLSNILGFIEPQESEITHCSQYTLFWSAGQHLHTWRCQTQVSSLTEAIPLCSNKVVYCIIFRQYTTIYQYSDITYTLRSHYGNMFQQ